MLAEWNQNSVRRHLDFLETLEKTLLTDLNNIYLIVKRIWIQKAGWIGENLGTIMTNISIFWLKIRSPWWNFMFFRIVMRIGFMMNLCSSIWSRMPSLIFSKVNNGVPLILVYFMVVFFIKINLGSLLIKSPMKKAALNINDFRLIRLCNTVLKLITKIIVSTIRPLSFFHCSSPI